MMASLELFVFSLVHVLVQQKSVTVNGNWGKKWFMEGTVMFIDSISKWRKRWDKI